MQKNVFESVLTPAAVDECTERLRFFLTAMKMPKREIIRYTLAVEEILLKTLDEADGTVPFVMKTGTRFFKTHIVLEIAGNPHNIYAPDVEQKGILGESMLRHLGLSPDYTYIGNANQYDFRLRRKSLNPLITLLIAIVLAGIVGACGSILPIKVKEAVLTGFFNPLHDTFLNVLGCIAGPMVFLSVAWGIYGMGDATTLKRIGKRLLGGYIGTVFLVCTLFGLPCIFLFKLNFSENIGSMADLSAIFQIVLGVFPKNIFSPFVDGNTLQIIFLACVIGLAMLFLGKKTNAVAMAVEQINYIVQLLIEIISKLVPYFIFIVLVEMIWSDAAKIFLTVIKFFAVFIGAVLLADICVLCYTGLRNRVSPILLAKKGLATFLIATTTASSAAAFGTNTQICQKELGVDKTVTSFGIPLGMVIFKPYTALSYTVVSIFFAEMYGVQLSVSWLLILLLSAGILALATPPIPGGAMTAYTVLFAQLGIPPAALAIALACDVLVDFICTGSDQFSMQYVLMNQANKLGMVDREILQKRKHR